MAAALDAEQWGGLGTSDGTSDEKALELERPSACENDSRGGTRTHDPGIMSAVL